jgi:transcriptional regulator with XRE-family HTH domain
MAKRKTPRAKAAAAADEKLKWFSPVVARGIMEQKKLTVSRLARMANRNHQTVGNLLSGDDMKRAQLGLLHAIANALDVDVDLIQHPPAQFAERLLHPVRGFEHAYSILTTLEVNRLLDKCEAASRRDVTFWRNWIREGTDAYDSAVPVYVRAALSHLLTIGFHRSRWLLPFYPDATHLIASPRGDHSGALPDQLTEWHPLRGHPVKDPEHEAGIVHLIKAYEYVLQPWWDPAYEGVGFNYAELRLQTVQEAQHGAPRIEWQPAPSIGDQWMTNYADSQVPPRRCTERRDPYMILGLGSAK